MRSCCRFFSRKCASEVAGLPLKRNSFADGPLNTRVGSEIRTQQSRLIAAAAALVVAIDSIRDRMGIQTEFLRKVCEKVLG